MTAEEVRALQVGETVRVIKEGCEPVLCTVAFRGSVKNKFLTYRYKGQIKSFAIKDYPGMTYQRKEEKRRRQKPDTGNCGFPEIAH